MTPTTMWELYVPCLYLSSRKFETSWVVLCLFSSFSDTATTWMLFLILIVRSDGILSSSFDTGTNYVQLHWVWIQYLQTRCVTSVLESSVESLASYLILVNSLIVSLFCTFMQISEACQAVNVSSLKTNACRTDVNWRYRTSKLSQ
jgi:hypothetical protein